MPGRDDQVGLVKSDHDYLPCMQAQCAYCEVSLDTLGKKFKDPEKRLIGFRVLRYDV